MPIIIMSEEDRNTVSALLRGEVAELNDDGAGTYRRIAELFEKAPSEHTIRIIVHGGVVLHTERMPMGLHYEVQDFDNCPECGGVDPLCGWCQATGVRDGL